MGRTMTNSWDHEQPRYPRALGGRTKRSSPQTGVAVGPVFAADCRGARRVHWSSPFGARARSYVGESTDHALRTSEMVATVFSAVVRM
jgi:hypothetical protein